MSVPIDVPHAGTRIKAEVIPKGMSVTKAAQLLGVGRPALSNLLNGKAALTADMAARLEKAFSYPRADLIEMQARYEAAQAHAQKPPAETKAYVPPFLAIKANDIERWASHNIRARSRFAVFLRTLVHSTGTQLTKVDFPGNDDAERPGWDGLIEAGEGTPWIPAGYSGWEFGANEEPKKKADGDFQKSLKAHPDKKQRADMTFVFVTPRRWSGKAAWIASNKAKKLWKDVRAYDASDLEQWLEQSLPGQAWFANETDAPAHAVRSLDKCWADWANVSNPPLTGALFGSAIEAAKRTMLSRLSKAPDGPILITADSAGEALAFLAQLLGERGGEELASYRDRVLVFDQPGALPRLVGGAQSFIPVAFTRDVERELAPYAKSMHSIVIYPRNAAIEPAILLEPASYEPFAKALEELGKDRDEQLRLANESGRSLTVLRRRLSTVPAVRTPAWAADQKIAASLVPFLFVGAWDSKNGADRIGLSLLAGDRPYDELERECQVLTEVDDAPLWSAGTSRGVVSKLDLLYAISGVLTYDDLNRYFSMAEIVLGEDDPALDLDKNQRWAAAIHGNTREFSSAFRAGISETLVLLAVNGSRLFKARLGFDTEIEAARIVRALLPTPLATRNLEANEHDLPTYAEAAPDTFLSILERDLTSEHPAVLDLLRPVDPNAFGSSPSRSGLLWALEGLCWSPTTLPRAALILARLAQVEINDNWANKPARSLEAIFRAWMPQTAATPQQRMDLLKTLARKFPEVAWEVCMAQFGSHRGFGTYSHKPKWRNDGFGFGEPLPTWGPILAFVREVVAMALSWKDHSLAMLCDLVERLHDLSDADQVRLWALVREWAATKATDVERAALREKIRVSVLTKRAAVRTMKSPKTSVLTTGARAMYAALEPRDLLHKHSWLFRDVWVDESADELDDIENFDFEKRNERIRDLRIKALREIRAKVGLAAMLDLAARGNASSVIGALAAEFLLSKRELTSLLGLALKPVLDGSDEANHNKSLINSALHALVDTAKREAVLKAVSTDLSDMETAQLLALAPYCAGTWKLVDALDEEAQSMYWRSVMPGCILGSTAEEIEGVERLLKAKRPRAAFSSIRLTMNQIDVELLFRILSEVNKGGDDKPDQYLIEPYRVQEAFKHLNGRSALTLDQKAQLELAYIEALAPPWNERRTNGIPNLERYVEAHPELFVEAVTWAYKRSDGANDPPKFQAPPEHVKTLAQRGRKLLDAIRRIPGHNTVDELETDRLATWIATVRRACAELGRADVADICVGRLLSRAPVGKDDIWPCEPVREVMEDIQSELMARGAHTGVYNSRGVHWRGEGGDQERQLADKYRSWGQALQVSYPFVAARLLMRLAETYEQEADHEDTRARIRRRLH